MILELKIEGKNKHKVSRIIKDKELISLSDAKARETLVKQVANHMTEVIIKQLKASGELE